MNITENEFKNYLDHAIRTWRIAREEALNNKDWQYVHTCECYIDAFQSVKISAFAETLQTEDN